MNELCIRDLQITNPRHDKSRIKATKKGLLNYVYVWIFSNDDFKRWRYGQQGRLVWIKGDPRKGKTTLLCGIIDD